MPMLSRRGPRHAVRWLPALLLASVAGFALPPVARAQWSPGSACDNRPSTAEQSGCLERALRDADAALNAAYRRALHAIETDADSSPAQRAAWRQALQAAQRYWIAFRDADCGEPVGYEWHQGTGAGPAAMACSLDKTVRRSRELAQRYAGN